MVTNEARTKAMILDDEKKIYRNIKIRRVLKIFTCLVLIIGVVIVLSGFLNSTIGYCLLGLGFITLVITLAFSYFGTFKIE
jgi:small-conductance mechanosensitive channel